MKGTQEKQLLVRPGLVADIPQLYKMLMKEVEQNPYYNQITKSTEKERLTPAYLKHLHAIEPQLLMVGEVEGEIVGFIIACPHQGALIMDWALALDEYKSYHVSANVLRGFISHFDQGQWHKISAYVRTSNRRPALLLSAFKFKKSCVLKEHFFGEDYALWELPLNKIKEGYELGIRLGKLGRLKKFFSGS